MKKTIKRTKAKKQKMPITEERLGLILAGVNQLAIMLQLPKELAMQFIFRTSDILLARSSKELNKLLILCRELGKERMDNYKGGSK